MAEGYSSSGILEELLEGEVGGVEPCQKLVVLLEEVGAEEEGEEEEQGRWMWQDQEEVNHQRSQEVLPERWRS